MSRLRIAVLGAGMIGREHIKLVRAHNQTELVAIADPTPAAGDFAKSLGVAWHADYEAMLDAVKPDGVISAVPNQLHLATGLACIARGIPCIMEKPLADTVTNALALADASEKAGVPVLTGHHRRHSPDIIEAARAVKAGELGDLVAVNGLWFVKKQDAYYEAEWRRKPGGGPLLINFIHDIDALRAICGEVHSIQAVTSNRVRGFAVEDTAAIIIRFASGALGTFTLSDCVPSPYTWDCSSGQALYFPWQPENTYFIGGRKGTLAVPSLDLWQPLHEGGDWREPNRRHRLDARFSNCYMNQLDNFCAVIRGEAKPVIDAREGAMTVAAALAVGRSAQEHREVTIAEMLKG